MKDEQYFDVVFSALTEPITPRDFDRQPIRFDRALPVHIQSFDIPGFEPTMFHLENYQGPISRVEAWITRDVNDCDHWFVQTKVTMRVTPRREPERNKYKILGGDKDGRIDVYRSNTTLVPTGAVDAVLNAIRDDIRFMTLHELDECLRVNGALRWDPHRDEEPAFVLHPLEKITFTLDFKSEDV